MNIIKTIVKTNGTEVMDFEDVMKNYGNMIYKMAHKYTNGHDFEDLMQEGYIVLYETFLSYDEIHCFSTHLTWQLRKRFTQLLVAKKAAIRNDENLEIIRFDKKTADKHNDYYNSVLDIQSESEFENVLNRIVIESMMSKLDETEKELLNVLMGKISGADLARKNNVTRQNISQQAKKLKNRLRILLKDAI